MFIAEDFSKCLTVPLLILRGIKVAQPDEEIFVVTFNELPTDSWFVVLTSDIGSIKEEEDLIDGSYYHISISHDPKSENFWNAIAHSISYIAVFSQLVNDDVNYSSYTFVKIMKIAEIEYRKKKK